MTVTIRQLLVPRLHRKVFQGQTVQISAIFEDDMQGVAPLLALPEAPTISVYKPDDTVLLDNVPMQAVSTGIWQKLVSTFELPLGVYTASCTGKLGTDFAVTVKQPVFTIIRLLTGGVNPPPPPVFTFLAIRDQSSAIWYWWIGADNTVNWDDEQPVIPGKTPIQIDLASIPYWLTGTDPAGTVGYIYPSLDGAPTVTPDATPLPIGSGLDSIPAFIGVNAGTYTPFITADRTVDVLVTV